MAKPSDSVQAGRPTKYSDDMLSNSHYYIQNYDKLGQAIPTAAGLAVYLGVAKSTIYKWVEGGKRPAFSDVLEYLSNSQESLLINNGLKGTFNSTITKLVLCKHNYSDKPEESSGEDDKAHPLNITFKVADPVSDITVTNAKT